MLIAPIGIALGSGYLAIHALTTVRVASGRIGYCRTVGAGSYRPVESTGWTAFYVIFTVHCGLLTASERGSFAATQPTLRSVMPGNAGDELAVTV